MAVAKKVPAAQECMKSYQTNLTTGITRTKEFERKHLASFAVNVGTKCGHDCLHCSTGALLRMHRSFKEAGQNPFGHGYAIVDPGTPDRVAADARRIKRRGLVQICTVVDAWSPEAQEHQLGRRCLAAVLAEPGWTVRILTKNAAVVRDYDIIQEHRDRVLVGLSLTGTADEAAFLNIIEPHASPIEQRVAALRDAHARGLRTYGMLCPLLPGIADAPDKIDKLVELVVQCGAEEIFVEPVNARGPALRVMQEALEAAGHTRQAAAIGRIRKREAWSGYVVELIRNIQASVQRHTTLMKLRFLLYPSGLRPEDLAAIRQNEAGVIWLGKD
jgi:DNA repair photolyase